MKILRLLPEPVASSPGDFDIHPDSTLLTGSNPFFYPDSLGSWQAVPHLGVRIGRLGKAIAEKFAPRYYDGVTLALHMQPVATDGSHECPLSPGQLSAMDSTLALGSWTEPAQWPWGQPAGAGQEWPTPVQADIDRAVAHVSRHTTLRTGDVILIPLALRGHAGVPVHPRTHLKLIISGHLAIYLKVV